jgi:hypothetical protein
MPFVKYIPKLLLLLTPFALAQSAQNPSPMVEHVRQHPRLAETHPAGQRVDLTLGHLFVPQHHKKSPPLLLFFHGPAWLAETAAERNGMACISFSLGAGSGTYEKSFRDPALFLSLLHEAEQKAGLTFSSITLAGWSAGGGALRQILSDPTAYARIDRVIFIDGIHASYAGGKPGPLDSSLETEKLQPIVQFARDAIAGKKRLLITHSEIFPGTYASTTETAHYLLTTLGVGEHATLRWGPQRMQEISRTSSGKFMLIGYAGNSAPDHVDQLHALPEFLRWK